MCKSCYTKNHYREDIGLITARRSGYQNENHNNAKGDKGQNLLNTFKGWKDLNEVNDNYNFPIDSIDQKGLLHQVRTKWYDPLNKIWLFGNLEKELLKTFEDIYCFCISNDGNMVERMYIFPSNVLTSSITIYNNKNKHWYDKYIVTDEETLKKINEIWKKIVNKKMFPCVIQKGRV